MVVWESVTVAEEVVEESRGESGLLSSLGVEEGGE